MAEPTDQTGTAPPGAAAPHLPDWFKRLILPAAIEGLDGAGGALVRASWNHTKLMDGAEKFSRPKGLDAIHAILTRACAATTIQGLDLAVAGGKPADPHLASSLPRRASQNSMRSRAFEKSRPLSCSTRRMR